MSQLIFPFLYFLLGLTSCAIFTPPPYPVEKHLSWEELQKLENWEWQGQVALSNSKEQTSFQVSWKQSHQDFKVHLWGPLGQNHAELSCENGLCQLKTQQDIFYSESPRELLKTYTGWDMPVEFASFWVKGIPAPNESYDFTKARDKTPATLIQTGWRIQYLEYQPHPPHLPRKIRMIQDTLQIRVHIREWKFLS